MAIRSVGLVCPAEKTKYDYIVASLSPKFVAEVRDLILKTPDTDPYIKLKEQLIKRTAALEQCRLQQLFNAEELGDRKPSQLLRHMQQLLGEKGNTTDRSFFRQLFLQWLPSNVCMVLASTTETTSIDKLANLPDKITEFAIATSSISAVSQSQLSSEMEQLHSQSWTLKVRPMTFHISTTKSPSYSFT